MATKPIFEILSGVTAGNGGAKKFPNANKINQFGEGVR
jgi:hypothetical protein